jgi:hypothetical protein
MKHGTGCSYELTPDFFKVRMPGALLIFTRREHYFALKRGKSHRRHGGEKLTKQNEKIPELFR